MFYLFEDKPSISVAGDVEVCAGCILKLYLFKHIMKTRLLILADNPLANVFFEFIFELKFPRFSTSSVILQILVCFDLPHYLESYIPTRITNRTSFSFP